MEIGAALGRYHIVTQLARGGMAEVWLAISKGVGGFEKKVVLKTILPELVENPEFVRMFINEALLAARLNHPHIVQIFDLGNINGRYFIAMEYVPGRTLRQISRVCRRRSALLPQWFVARVLSVVCEALQYAHDLCDDNGKPLDLVHRDATPENIMISFTGAVKVLDFGVAKARSAALQTQAGTLKGKHAYVSPEQVRGMPADRRSDVFSCGVVLYELLTGVRPFKADNDLELLRKVARGESIPPREIAPWIPVPLEEIILKALQTDPSNRYVEAGQMAEDLTSYLSELKDNNGRRELSIFVSGLFPNEPAIPSDVQKQLSSSSSGEFAVPTSLGLTPQSVEYESVEILTPKVLVVVPNGAVPDTVVDKESLDSTTFEVTGLDGWVQEISPIKPATPPPTPPADTKVPTAARKPGAPREAIKQTSQRLSWIGQLNDSVKPDSVDRSEDETVLVTPKPLSDEPTTKVTPAVQVEPPVKAQAKPKAKPKPAKAKPAAKTKPATEAKPAAKTKPATEAKPAEAKPKPASEPFQPQKTPKPDKMADLWAAVHSRVTHRLPQGDDDDPIATVWSRRLPTDERAEPKEAAAEEEAEEEAPTVDEPPPAQALPDLDLASPYGLPTHGGSATDVFHIRRTLAEEGSEEDVFTALRRPAGLDQPSAHPFGQGPTATPEAKVEVPTADWPEDWWRRRDEAGPKRAAADHFERGLELMREGAYKDALEQWETATSLVPDNRIYRTNLKRLKERAGDDGPAPQKAQRALNLIG